MMRSHYPESECILLGEIKKQKSSSNPQFRSVQREAVQQHGKDVLFLEIS